MLLDPGCQGCPARRPYLSRKAFSSRLPQARSYRLHSGRVGSRIAEKDAVWPDAARQVTIHNSLASRSALNVREIARNALRRRSLPSSLFIKSDRSDDDEPLYQFLIPRADVEEDQYVVGQAHQQDATERADQPPLTAK